MMPPQAEASLALEYSTDTKKLQGGQCHLGAHTRAFPTPSGFGGMEMINCPSNQLAEEMRAPPPALSHTIPSTLAPRHRDPGAACAPSPHRVDRAAHQNMMVATA